MQIGIIDSGAGGISFYQSLKKRYPFFYYQVLIDKVFFPFGQKSFDDLRKRGKYLIEKMPNCDYIIIACNTLSIALDGINDSRIITILDLTIEEARKYLNIGIMGSFNTINSNYYQKRLNISWAYDATKEINEIEKKGNCSKINIPKLDVLILGCTHFIKIKKAFEGLNIISQDELDFHKYWKD